MLRKPPPLPRRSGDSLIALPQAIGFALDYAGVIGTGIGGAKKDSFRKQGLLKRHTVAVLHQVSKAQVLFRVSASRAPSRCTSSAQEC